MDVSNAPEQAENDIKINISNEEVEKIIEKYYGLKGGHMTQLLGYDDLNFKYSPKDNKNPFIKLMWPHGYVVKIMNSSDSKLKNLCEAQNNIMVFLSKSIINTNFKQLNF